MECPECPVCLQTYNGDDTIPRVLACGHSVCQKCIHELATTTTTSLTGDALRCPSCNQLVPFSRAIGPSALPKNIELLRLIPSTASWAQSIDQKTIHRPSSSPSEFSRIPWSRRALWLEWKDSILPQDSLRIGVGDEKAGVLVGVVKSLIGRPWFLRENEKVSLLIIESGDYCSSYGQEWLRLSYAVRVIEALGKMENGVRDGVRAVVDAGLKERRGLCRVYGLWMDFEDRKSNLYLVCQVLDKSLSQVSKEGRVLGDHLYWFCTLGLELCEVVMSLHSQGITCGCLTESCFCFDKFGHCFLNLSKVFLVARRIWQNAEFDEKKVQSFACISPELFVAIHDETGSKDLGFQVSMSYCSDIWSLGCILSAILVGHDVSIGELLDETYCLVQKGTCKNFTESYNIWKEKLVSQLKNVIKDIKFESLLNILELCLCYEPHGRPQVYEIWYCFHAFLGNTSFDDVATGDFIAVNDNPVCCLADRSLHFLPKRTEVRLASQVNDVDFKISTDADFSENNRIKVYDLHHKDEKELGAPKPITLQGHHDCVTGLAVKGDFLFSSSFDKTINVWSLQDFSLIQVLKGHEHRVMAIVAEDSTSEPFFVSGDSGNGIFVWNIGQSVDQEPQMKWYEHNDWRYSGIHSLAISGTGYLYTGSGDKSIKAWSLQDYSLTCTMTGHNSTVSSLAVACGILYSGSWDGTIRLWWLHDHSALAILENDAPQNFAPVLSLSAEGELLASSHENGFLKIWRNNVLVRAEQIHSGAVSALHMDKKILFTGGWDKTINIKELPENESEADIVNIASIGCDAVITCLLHWDGKLFVGFSSKDIKVYPFGFW